MDQVNPSSDYSAHEQEPSDLECGISVRGLQKNFKVLAISFKLIGHVCCIVLNRRKLPKIKGTKHVLHNKQWHRVTH